MTITVSIETALALKEAGWTKECVFSLYQYSQKNYELEQWIALTIEEQSYNFVCPCPTAQELIDEFNDDFDFVGIKIEAKNLSEALAKLWINHSEQQQEKCQKEPIAQKDKKE